MSAGADADFVGADLFDEYGEHVGHITDVIRDIEDRPIWVVVRVGVFESREVVVPLAGCTCDVVGVRVPYTRSAIEASPYSRSDTALNMLAMSAYYDVELPPPPKRLGVRSDPLQSAGQEPHAR